MTAQDNNKTPTAPVASNVPKAADSDRSKGKSKTTESDIKGKTKATVGNDSGSDAGSEAGSEAASVDEDLAELDEVEQLDNNNGEGVVADEDEIMQDFEEELLREDPTPVEAPAVKLAEAEREKKINSIDVGKTLKSLSL
jgi:hypothetical protein